MSKRKESIPKKIKKFYNKEKKTNKSEMSVISKTKEEVIKRYKDANIDVLIESFLELLNKREATKRFRHNVSSVIITFMLTYALTTFLGSSGFSHDNLLSLLIHIVSVLVGIVLVLFFIRHLIYKEEYFNSYEVFIVPYELKFLHDKLVDAGINPDDGFIKK